jgi:tetratricopeptide (TPR) repeat protein
MRDLIELANLLNKTKLKSSGILDIILEPDSKMQQLYDALVSQRVRSDDEGLSWLLDGGDEASKLPNLKNKLKDRMLDSVFLLDFKEPGFSDRQKAYFECYKKWAAGMILVMRNAKVSGIDLLEKLLRHSIRFEFTELTCDILRVLRIHYSTNAGDLKKYENTREQLHHYQEIWQMENQVEDFYTELVIRYVNSKATKMEVSEQAKLYYGLVKPYLEKCDSFKLQIFGRLVQVFAYSSLNDYVTTARLCEEAVRFFDKKDYDSGFPLQVFYYNLITCYLQLREFEKGQHIIERCQNLVDPGSFNWFKLQELFFLLAMHTAHYEMAAQVLNKVMNDPRFDNQSFQITEIWKIYHAYVHFLNKIGKIPSDSHSLQRNSKFKLSKFLNETPVFSKDKRGMNIPILVVQILYALAENDYQQCVDRMEGIEKYCSRYLKQNDTFRSNCFIKMLLQIPMHAFHSDRVIRHTQKLYEMLCSVPMEVANQTWEIEIIPYESLWQLTVSTLGKETSRRDLLRPTVS